MTYYSGLMPGQVPADPNASPPRMAVATAINPYANRRGAASSGKRVGATTAAQPIGGPEFVSKIKLARMRIVEIALGRHLGHCGELEGLCDMETASDAVNFVFNALGDEGASLNGLASALALIVVEMKKIEEYVYTGVYKSEGVDEDKTGWGDLYGAAEDFGDDWSYRNLIAKWQSEKNRYSAMDIYDARQTLAKAICRGAGQLRDMMSYRLMVNGLRHSCGDCERG